MQNNNYYCVCDHFWTSGTKGLQYLPSQPFHTLTEIEFQIITKHVSLMYEKTHLQTAFPLETIHVSLVLHMIPLHEALLHLSPLHPDKQLEYINVKYVLLPDTPCGRVYFLYNNQL